MTATTLSTLSTHESAFLKSYFSFFWGLAALVSRLACTLTRRKQTRHRGLRSFWCFREGAPEFGKVLQKPDRLEIGNTEPSRLTRVRRFDSLVFIKGRTGWSLGLLFVLVARCVCWVLFIYLSIRHRLSWLSLPLIRAGSCILDPGWDGFCCQGSGMFWFSLSCFPPNRIQCLQTLERPLPSRLPPWYVSVLW